MPKHVLLYGGAFDPVTKAHRMVPINVWEQLLATLYPDCELWYLPAYSDAFNKKKFSELEHRMAMLDLLVNDIIRNPSVSICTHEIDMANNAGTYAVVQSLRKTYPDVEFMYLIGLDQAMSIRRWRKSRDLVKTIPFITTNRAGVWNHTGTFWHQDSPHMYLRKTIVADRVSSSQVRSDFMDSERRNNLTGELHPMLDPHIHQYIMDNNLYREAI